MLQEEVKWVHQTGLRINSVVWVDWIYTEEHCTPTTVVIQLELLLGVITCQQGAHNQAHSLLVTVVASDSAYHHWPKIGNSQYLMVIIKKKQTLFASVK